MSTDTHEPAQPSPDDTTPSPAPGKKRSGNDAIANYLVVLLVFAGLAALVVLFTNWGQQEQLPEVDHTNDADQFTEFAPFTSYVPEDLPEDWVATSSRLTVGDAAVEEEPTGPVTWDVGFVTSSDEYASFRTSDDDPDDFIPEMTQDGDPAGNQQVDGDTWDRYESADRRSLVRAVDGSTLVVTGTAEYEELATLAESLEPQE